MCGRFSLARRLEELAERFELEELEADLSPLDPAWDLRALKLPRYNIAPTQPVLAIISRNPARDGVTPILASGAAGPRGAAVMRWGLIPHWAKNPSVGSRMINARAEGLEQKPSFRNSFRRRRCLIPADGFYEWSGEGRQKKPFRMTLKDQEIFSFAGLWEVWKSPDGPWVPSCTIITTSPNDLVARLHNRMPVILTRDQEKTWLDPALTDPSLLHNILGSYSSASMVAYEVSTLVNSPKNDGPECIEPVQSLW